MNRLLKQLYFLLVPKPRLPQDRAVILMYHSISDWEHFTSVSPARFKEQMEYLAEHRYPVIALSELVRRLKAREPLRGAVVITFDDGYRDNLTAAYPILKKYAFPATVFIETGLIGESYDDVPHLTREEMRSMADLVEFGAHTDSHPKLRSLSKPEQREEIVASREAVERIMGKPCPLFAYPFGNYGPDTLKIMHEAEFEGAVTVREGTVGAGDNLFELPRVSIDSSTTMVQFKGKLSTAIDRYEARKR